MKKIIRILMVGVLSIGATVFGIACNNEKSSSESSSSESSFEEIVVDTSMPQVTVLPSDKKGVEAGTIYDFSADRASVAATDDVSESVEVRVVDIARKDGRSVYSASFIDKYQFTQAGDYVVTLAISDLSENKAYATYSIEVVDTKAPILVGESAYEVVFDENYDIVLPTISIEEYSTYTVQYRMTDALGRAWEVQEGGVVKNPLATTYEVEYLAEDSFGFSQSFVTSVTVSNAAPQIIIENEMGAVWVTEKVSLPKPKTERLSNVSTNVYLVSGSTMTKITNPSAYTFTQSGEYTFRYEVEGTWYEGGDFYKTGAEIKTVSKDIVVEVEDLGVVDFETHNGSTLPVYTSIDGGAVGVSVKVVESEEFGDGHSLRIEMLGIGYGRGVALGKNVPLPEKYDAIRLFVQGGGSEANMEISGGFIADENGTRSYFETLTTEKATEGTYYILSLSDTTLTNVREIYISNSYGAGGAYKDEFGIMRQPGETRDFYIDNVSFVVKPTLIVDAVALEEKLLFAEDSITLPKEEIVGGEQYEAADVRIAYSLNGGEAITLDGYSLDNLTTGTYVFTYSANVGGAKLLESFTLTVYPKVPSIIYKNELGLLRAGQSVNIPTATAVWMDNDTVVTTQYRHEADNANEWTVGTSISTLEEGEYIVQYTAIYNGTEYVEEFTFQVLSAVVDRHTFTSVNGEIDGSGVAKGDTGYTVSFADDVLKFTGWWGGIMFDEPLSLNGANVFVIKVKGAASIANPAFRYYDQNNKEYTTELVISYPTITTEYQEYSIILDSSITEIKGFWILGRQTETYVDEVYLAIRPVITYVNTLSDLKAGNNIALPEATTLNMEGATVTTQYKLSTETEWTTGTTIENAVEGEYVVRYTASYKGVTYVEEFTIEVVGPTMTDIIGGTSVEIWATQGTVTLTEEGLAFEYSEEWWVKTRFDAIDLPTGTTKIVIVLKASTAIDSLLFQVLDSTGYIAYTANMAPAQKLGTEFVSVELDISSLGLTAISGLEICACGQVVTVQSVTFA